MVGKQGGPPGPCARIVAGPVPKHAQLRHILERECAETLSPGDPLPGERTLEETYGVSRITVRRAIGDLVAAGTLRRVRGKGTFVAPQLLARSAHLKSFSDEMRAQGVTATASTLLAAHAAPPAELAEFFGTDPEVRHVRLRRLRLGDGQPYAIDDAWYNSALVPDLLEHDLTASIYDLVAATYGISVTAATQTVTATTATLATAPLLDVPAGTALLNIDRRVFCADPSGPGAQRAPIEACVSVYRTDRYHLTYRVGPEAGQEETMAAGGKAE